MAGIADKAGILLTIRANSDDADKKIKAFQKDLKELNKVNKDSLGSFETMAATSGLTAKEFQNIKVGALAAVAGIGALVGATAAAAVGLFTLTENAAKYGSAIFEATEKTGASTATISALQYAANLSGTSLDALTNALVKFNVLLGKANQDNEKANETLNQYGITARTVDEALIQAITTIAKMTSADQQAAAAAALFKDETAEILPVIKSFDGDLPGLIAKLRELGLIMSDENARAAKVFGDQMDTLKMQLAGVGRTIAFELMPAFQNMATDISHWLKSNPGEVKAWGKTLEYILKRVAAAFLNIRNEAEAAQDAWKQFTNLQFIKTDEDLERERRRDVTRQKIYNIIAGTDLGVGPWQQTDDDYAAYKAGKLPTPTAPFKEADDDEKKAAEKRARDREAAFQKELNARAKGNRLMLAGVRTEFATAQKLWEEAFLSGEETKERFREVSLENIENYRQQIAALLANAYTIDATGKTGTELANAKLELQNATAALNNEVAREKADLEQTITGVVKKETEVRKRISEKALADQQALDRAYSETRQQEFENELQIKAITERDFIRNTSREKITLLEKELRAETDVTKQTLIRQEIERARLRLIRELIDLEERTRKEALDYWSKAEESIIAIGEAQKKNAEDDEERIARQNAKAAEAARQDRLNRTIGSGQTISSLDQLMGAAIDNDNTAAIAGIEAMATAFQGLGQAIGQVVQAWVLYGSAGASVRQVTAQILAGIAQQAAMKAIFELAEGFAALALQFFGIPNAGPSATAHFTAAAIYGSIAGVAAIAGRRVAGTAFQRQSGTATSGEIGGNSSDDEGRDLRTRFNGFGANQSQERAEIRDAINRLSLVTAQHEETLHTFAQRIEGVNPGEVVMLGAGDAAGAIHGATQGYLSDNPGATGAYKRNFGDAR